MEKIKPIICIREINENIRRVRLGEPLTKSLRILNTSCKFKEEWDNQFNMTNPEFKKEKREYMKKYRQKPESKEYMKKYQQRPEVRKRKREYYQIPDVKRKNNEYEQRPEVKKRRKKYYQKPEVKKRLKDYSRNFMRKKLNIPKSRWRI